MTTSTPLATPAITPAAAPRAPEVQAAFTRAGSGQMPLNELLDQAQAWQNAGQNDAAADLYGEWIAHTDSPFKHVAL